MIATTKEQSARLIACGVDPKTADMCLINGMPTLEPYYEAKSPIDDYIHDYELTPAWSLSNLLSFLPTPIFTENRKQFVMSVKRHNDVWFISYENVHETLFQSHSDDPIEAVVRAIENLTFHGYQLHEVNFASNKNEKK